MLNPQKPSHIRLGRFLFHLPHNQRRWRHYLGFYQPVLQPAFEHNEAARLLVLKGLKCIDHKNRKGYHRFLKTMIPTVREAGNAEKALCGIMNGLMDIRLGNPEHGIRYIRGANKYQHRFFVPYLLAADDFANRRLSYPESAANYQTAIDCIYEYPPLNDITKNYLVIAYAGLCYCHTMLHQYDEAKIDHLHAEQFKHENAALLRAKAYLNAALRRKEEALASTKEYSKYDAEGQPGLQEKIERILAEKDTHFTRLPSISPEKIAAFWQSFHARESELMHLLDTNCRSDANDIFKELLEAPDPYTQIDYGIDILIKDNAYMLYFNCSYSRTYTIFVQDILAACPEDIRQRWIIVCDP